MGSIQGGYQGRYLNWPLCITCGYCGGKKKKQTCVIGMGCITLDGKLITCNLEILEIMLLIVLCHFLKGKNIAMSVLKK
jgi:hypothetical protein